MNLEQESLLRLVAVEMHRLARVIERPGIDSAVATPLRYTVRKLRAELQAQGVSYLDLTGQHYDSGMAVEVAPGGEEGGRDGRFRIAGMPQPVILWNGCVLAPGSVILERMVEKPASRASPRVPAWHRMFSKRRRQKRAEHARKTRIRRSVRPEPVEGSIAGTERVDSTSSPRTGNIDNHFI